MKIFDIDFTKLVSLLLPEVLRKFKITAFLQSAVFPVYQLYYSFMESRGDNIYKINHNGQMCYLRAALNDSFDKSLRRIYINSQVEHRDPVMFYKRLEAKPVMFYKRGEQKPVIFNKREYIGTEAVDFVVYVPHEYQFDELRIKAVLNYYKLVSKRYTIHYF